MKPLAPKQEKFCQEYAINGNAKQSAISAGYSEKNAESIGCRLSSNVKVKARISELLSKRENKIIITADRVLTELARLATCDISQAFDVNGDLLDIHKMPEDCRRAIAGIEIEVESANGDNAVNKTETRTKKIKFWDKNKSLETIARHLKMLTDKVEHSATGDLAELIRQARERRKK